MRYFVSIVAGVAVALLLFLLMNTLISGTRDIDRGPDAGKVIDFIRIQQEEITQIKDRTPPKPPEKPKEPPPPPKVQVSQQDKPPPQQLNMETPQVDVPVSTGGGPYIGNWQAAPAAAEGDVIPIFRIEPRYPRDALLSGTEGYVTLEITILEDGSVEDPVVIDAQPRRVFDQAAKRAVLKWKFKPRIVDGVAVKRKATQTIEFKLDEAQL